MRRPRGTRVVLVIPAEPAKLDADDSRRLSGALDQLAAAGWVPVAVVEPERHLDALRMVLGGLADLVVVTRSQDFPLVMQIADLGRSALGSRGTRTQRILRSDAGATVRPVADVEATDRTRRTAFADRPPMQAQRLKPDEQMPADGPEVMNRGAELRTAAERGRASDRHRRAIPPGRGRRSA